MGGEEAAKSGLRRQPVRLRHELDLRQPRMLHAARLSFPDPRTDAPVTLSAPLPADFAGALEKLGLSGVYPPADSDSDPDPDSGDFPCSTAPES